jgi:HK97 family phage portal protein
VNLSQTESSLQKVAVYASVRLLREVVTMLPIDFFTGRGDQKREVSRRSGWRTPPATATGSDWLGQLTYSDAMRGNVVARIASRDNNFRPNQLVLQHPDEVTVHRNSDGRGVALLRHLRRHRDVWHRRSFPIPGCIWGLSPIGIHALTIGLGISAEQFGAQFFLDGGHPTALFQNTQKTIDPEAAATIKQRIRAVLSGNREPLVLGADWDYKPLQVTPPATASSSRPTTTRPASAPGSSGRGCRRCSATRPAGR